MERKVKVELFERVADLKLGYQARVDYEQRGRDH
jgi:hypothetical protein